VTQHLLHCLACGDIRYVAPTRTLCGCQRSSARLDMDTIVLVGPGRVLDAGREDIDIEVIRPSVAIAM
jgi:hypothetical protein